MIEHVNGTDSRAHVDPTIAPLLARLAEIGGPDDTRPEADVLADLADAASRIAGVVGGWRGEETAAEIAAEIARLREAVAEGPEAIGALLGAIERRRAALGIREERRVATLAERLLARLQRPALVHVPTGLPTLDAATRGGLLLRRVHVIGGEPDAGKTALLVQLLLEAARRGYAVAIYAVDEPGEGIEDRIGQSLGVGLEDLEANVQASILWLAAAVRDMPHVLLIEQGEDGFATVEDAADALLEHAKRHGLKGAVLGVDSLQTARCRAHLGKDAPRVAIEKIEVMTTALKACAKRGLGVLVTSELGRASYGNQGGGQGQSRKPPSSMAAFKGSGSIEYCMTVGIVLTRIASGEFAGDIKAVLPKNKRGDVTYRKAAIRLVRDPERCTYTDQGRIDGGADDEPARGAAKSEDERMEPACMRVRKALLEVPGGFSGNRTELAKLAGGKAATTRTAIAMMFSRGELVVAREEGQPPRIKTAAPKGATT